MAEALIKLLGIQTTHMTTAVAASVANDNDDHNGNSTTASTEAIGVEIINGDESDEGGKASS